MLPNVLLHVRSINPLRKGLTTERGLYSLSATAVRHYVGLAPQSSSDNVRYSMADPVDKGPRNTINSVTSGKSISMPINITLQFSNFLSQVSQVPVNQNLNSAPCPQVSLPPETDITAATGTAVGSSREVFSKLTTDGGTIKAISRKAFGDNVFRQKYETGLEYGDILLAPSSIGEIAIIKINGSTEYAMRRDAFLAKTSRVSLELGFSGLKGKETGIVQRIAHKVRGPGTIAISHYGGLYRLVLDEDEEFLANPSHLIAWDTRTAPTKLYTAKQVIPSPRSRLRRYHVFRNIVDSPSMQASLQFWNGVFRLTRNWILGAPDFVRLKGPGDFYLSSRIEPRFARSRLLNAISQADDSVEQAMSQAAIFPTAPAPSKEPERPHLGYATEKSKDGAITYYASVNPQGQVSFAPAKEVKVTSAHDNNTSS